METLANSVSHLQARKEAIEKELADIDSRFQVIGRALNSDGAAAQKPIMPADANPAPAASTSRDSSSSKRRKLQRWFASGEGVDLMKRYVHAPMPATDVMKVLARAKGYDKGLTPAMAKRFEATAYMAVANAVKSGAARRFKDGRIRVA